MVVVNVCEENEGNLLGNRSEGLVRHPAVHEDAVVDHNRIPRRPRFYDVIDHPALPCCPWDEPQESAPRQEAPHKA